MKLICANIDIRIIALKIENIAIYINTFTLQNTWLR